VPPEQSESLPASARALLEAVTAISSDLDLHSVLTRIVEAATQLTQARYGALGVIGSDAFLVEFVTTGMADAERAAIGDLPHGRGILGLLIHHPEPLRLDDLAQHPQSAGFPANHPPMGSFLGVPVRIRGTVYGNLYLTEKAGGRSFSEEDQSLVESLATTAGFVIDNARAYGLSERRRQWLEASAELSETLQPPTQLESALVEVARVARAMSGAAATAVRRLADGSAVHTIVAEPAALDRVERALASLDAEPWPRPDSAPVDIELGGYQATLVPLRTHLVGSGLLVMLFEHPAAPMAYEERSLLASFADQAGLAVDRAQAIEDRAELAVTSDRERIARDLHDLVIQRLFATGLQLQGVGLMVTSADVSARLDQAVEALDLTIKDIRGTIFELQRRDRGASLRADLRNLAREYAPLLRFRPTVQTTGPVDTAVSAEIREQLLPVLREALSNLARHAAADHAEISLAVDDREVRLSVVDDGVGIGGLTVESGLRNARRRSSALGGSLELTQRDPRGTSFVWRVPLR
jgi:signal transduction histidine kinase